MNELKRGNEAEFGVALRERVEEYDKQGVEALCDILIGHLRQRQDQYPQANAKPILKNLRKNRYFDLMQKVADAFLQSGQDDPSVRSLYAQALLDQSVLTAAIAVLDKLKTDVSGDQMGEDYLETCGLIGRGYKQFYIDACSQDPGNSKVLRNQRHLALSIKAYEDAYTLNRKKHLWHGINAVALMCRAEEDGVPIPEHPEPREDAEFLAKDILRQFKDLNVNGEAKPWDFATAAEACIALGKFDEAQKWLGKYVNDSGNDAFGLASTLRQFKEVWRHTLNVEPGSRLLPLLDNALLESEGGRVEISPESVSAHFTPSGEFKKDENYQKVFGTDSFTGLEAYRLGLERCRAIALIRMQGEARGFGTGFLIRGGELHPSFGDELLLMTNAHVISKDPSSARPADVEVCFEALAGVKCGVEEILWSSTPTQCDATLLRLNTTGDTSTLLKQVSPYPVMKDPPALNDKARVCIIGHPGGAGLSFSLQDNLLLDYNDQKMHYRTPTENGSSGSPVFNKQWKLIGLHHKGDSRMPKLNGQSGTYEANEGIRISKIIETLAVELGG